MAKVNSQKVTCTRHRETEWSWRSWFAFNCRGVSFLRFSKFLLNKGTSTICWHLRCELDEGKLNVWGSLILNSSRGFDVSPTIAGDVELRAFTNNDEEKQVTSEGEGLLVF